MDEIEPLTDVDRRSILLEADINFPHRPGVRPARDARHRARNPWEARRGAERATPGTRAAQAGSTRFSLLAANCGYILWVSAVEARSVAGRSGQLLRGTGWSKLFVEIRRLEPGRIRSRLGLPSQTCPRRTGLTNGSGTFTET